MKFSHIYNTITIILNTNLWERLHFKCYVFQPLAPIELISSSTQSNDTNSDRWEAEKEMKFWYQIYNIQKQEHEMLQRTNAKANARHNKHHIPH